MLSICVIGRNEEENLPRLIQSLLPLRERLNFPVETIFVDSDSTDRTVPIAKSFFDVVLILERSENLCASAGRNVGTAQATGEWILYLDGDMTLCGEFIPVMEQCLTHRESSAGCLGEYIYQ